MSCALCLASPPPGGCSHLLPNPLPPGPDSAVVVGPAAVRIAPDPMPHCVAPVQGVPCLLGYDDGGSLLDPTDDAIYQYQRVEAVEVAVDAPVDAPLPVDNVSYTSGMHIEHDVWARADRVFVAAEAALPGPLGERTRLDSWDGSVVLWVKLVGFSEGTTVADTWYPVSLFLPNTNKTGTTVETDWIGDDTDTLGPLMLEVLRLCFAPMIGGEEALVCDALPAKDLQAPWPGMTPRLRTGVAIHRSSISVATSPGEGVAHAPPGFVGDPASEALPPGAPASSNDEVVGHVVHVEPGLPAGASLERHAAERSTGPSQKLGQSSSPTLLSGASWLWAAAGAALLLAAALFHRILGARALEHAARAKLLAFAKERPGILIGDAAKSLGLSYHATRHHAAVLRRGGHLDVVRAGRNVALYPATSVPVRHRAALVHLARGPQAAVLRALLQRPGRSIAALAGELGCTKSTVHGNLARLAAQGLVVRGARGRYEVTEAGRDALVALDRFRGPAEAEPRVVPLQPAAQPAPAA